MPKKVKSKIYGNAPHYNIHELLFFGNIAQDVYTIKRYGHGQQSLTNEDFHV